MATNKILAVLTGIVIASLILGCPPVPNYCETLRDELKNDWDEAVKNELNNEPSVYERDRIKAAIVNLAAGVNLARDTIGKQDAEQCKKALEHRSSTSTQRNFQRIIRDAVRKNG
jgi:hypothetical protein